MSDDENESVCLKGTYSPYGRVKFTLEPSTVSLLKSYKLMPPDIINRAIDNYYLISNTTFGQSKLALTPKNLEGRKRSRRIYICFFKALNDAGIPVDPNYLANLLNLNSKEISPAFKETPIAILVEPEKLLIFYLHQIEASDMKDLCLDWLNSLRTYPKGQECIDNLPVKNVCIGLILCALGVGRRDMHNIADKLFSTVPYMSQQQKIINDCFVDSGCPTLDLEYWWLQDNTATTATTTAAG